MKVVNKQVKTVLTSATIELNQEELEFLRDVFNVIGGDPIHSRRRISAHLRDALEAAGMNMNPTDNKDKQGTIYFFSAEDLELRELRNKSKPKKVIWDSRYDDEVPF